MSGDPLPPGVSNMLEYLGSEISWKMLRTEFQWHVWASNNSEDGFKFSSAHVSLEEAVREVARQILTDGPEWVRG